MVKLLVKQSAACYCGLMLQLTSLTDIVEINAKIDEMSAILELAGLPPMLRDGQADWSTGSVWKQ